MNCEQRIVALEARVAKLEDVLLCFKPPYDTTTGRIDGTPVGKSSFPALKRDCDSPLAKTAVAVVTELARKYSERNLLIDDLAAKNTQLHREIEALKGNKS